MSVLYRAYPVTRVDQGDIEIGWQRNRVYIQRGLDASPTLLTLGTIHDKLLAGRMQLWEIYAGTEPCGAFVTEVIHESGRRALAVVTISGEGMVDWLQYVTFALENFARTSRCEMIIEFGRPGWEPILKKMGWVPGPRTMLKVLK